MVLLEAMDGGVPIVASNNSAIPEVLGENFPGLSKTGSSKDFAQKLSNLLVLSYRKKVLEVQSGRLKIFRAEPMAEKISQIYLL
jgi:glycosyltransferase involved in cell wall biosynthesis